MDKKRKSITVGNSEIVDCFKHLENIEVYESSSHGEEKTFQDVDETKLFFLHSTITENTNDETEEKENTIFKFSTRNIRRQRILTYKSRRRIEDT